MGIQDNDSLNGTLKESYRKASCERDGTRGAARTPNAKAEWRRARIAEQHRVISRDTCVSPTASELGRIVGESDISQRTILYAESVSR